MEPIKTTVWDPANYLKTEDQATAYLDDISKSGNPELISVAVGDVARVFRSAHKDLLESLPPDIVRELARRRLEDIKRIKSKRAAARQTQK